MTREEQPPLKRGPGRPATGRDPVRSVRIGNLWDRCVDLATGRGESMTTFVERALISEEKRLQRAATGKIPKPGGKSLADPEPPIEIPKLPPMPPDLDALRDALDDGT